MAASRTEGERQAVRGTGLTRVVSVSLIVVLVIACVVTWQEGLRDVERAGEARQLAQEATERADEARKNLEVTHATSVMSAEELGELAQTARKVADEVAKAQNDYLDAIASGETDAYVSKDAWTRLRGLFADDVSDSGVTWLYPDGTSASEFRWEARSLASASTDSVGCLWLACDEDGSTLAYARAWLRSDGLLHDLTRGTFARGRALASAEGADALRSRTEATTSLADELADLARDYGVDEVDADDRAAARAGASELRDMAAETTDGTREAEVGDDTGEDEGPVRPVREEDR